MTKSFKDLGKALGGQRQRIEDEARTKAAAEAAAAREAEEKKKRRANDVERATVAFDAETFSIMSTARADLADGGADVSTVIHVFVLKGVNTTSYEFNAEGGLFKWLSLFKLTIPHDKGATTVDIGFAHGLEADVSHITAAVIGLTVGGNKKHIIRKKFTPVDAPVSEEEIGDLLFQMIETYVK